MIAFSGSRRVAPESTEVTEAIFALTEIMPREAFDWGVVGDCPTGADKAIRIFHEHGRLAVGLLNIKTADWDTHGKAAGPIRNQAMIDDADALIAFPCPQSKGTWDAIRKAVKKGIPTLIIPIGVE